VPVTTYVLFNLRMMISEGGSIAGYALPLERWRWIMSDIPADAAIRKQVGGCSVPFPGGSVRCRVRRGAGYETPATKRGALSGVDHFAERPGAIG
jgi:hypothetical protein